MKRREPADVIDLTSARAGREQAEAALERVRLLCRRLLAAGDVLSLESVQMLEELGTAATLAAPEMERCLGTLDRALHEMRRLQSMIATLEGRGDPTDLERHLISKYRAQLTALEEAKWLS